MTSAEIILQTEKFVRDNFLYARPDLELPVDLPLLEVGIIDSMGVMELIGFLEETFSVSLEDSEITEENLGTLAAIGALVRHKLTADPDSIIAV